MSAGVLKGALAVLAAGLAGGPAEAQAGPGFPQVVAPVIGEQRFAIKNNTAARLTCRTALGNPGERADRIGWGESFVLPPGEDRSWPAWLSRLYVLCDPPAEARIYVLRSGQRYSWLASPGGAVRLRRVTP